MGIIDHTMLSLVDDHSPKLPTGVRKHGSGIQAMFDDIWEFKEIELPAAVQ